MLKGEAMQILINGQWRTQQTPLTVAQLLEELGLDPRRVAIEMNRDILPRARYAQTNLSDQDQLEIVTLVGGG